MLTVVSMCQWLQFQPQTLKSYQNNDAMFRSILEIPRIISLSHRWAFGRNCSTINLERIPSLYDHSFSYFLENPKYTVFDVADHRVYEFDVESRKTVESSILSMGKPFPWTHVPTECSNVDLIATLKSISDYCRETNTSLTSEQFDGFIDEIARRLPKFSTNEAICALQVFARLPMTVRQPFKSRNFAELMIGLDQAVVINASADKWSIDQTIYVASIWSMIRTGKVSIYAKFFGRFFNQSVKHMTAEQIAQSMCYTHLLRQPIDDVAKLENTLEEYMPGWTPLEVAMVCTNIKRIDTYFNKPELCEKFVDNLLMNDLNDLNGSLLSSILHILEKSSLPSTVNKIAQLQHKLQPSLDDQSLRMCTQIANLGSGLHLSNDAITEYTLHRCMNEPNGLASLLPVELERLSRIIGMLNFTSASGIEITVGKAILAELRNRIDQFAERRFYLNFIRIQRNLSMLNIYDAELLANTLRPDYIRWIYGRNKQMDADLYALDAYARLNLAGIYNGDVLKDDSLMKLGTFLTDYMPHETYKNNYRNQYVMDVAECVQKEFGHFVYANAVAHYRQQDIFVGIDTSTGEPIDCTHLFPPPYTGQLIPAHEIIGDNPNLRIFAFIAAHMGMFCVDSGRCTGFMRQKVQQLELLGYEPVLIERLTRTSIDMDELCNIVRQKFRQKFDAIRATNDE